MAKKIGLIILCLILLGTVAQAADIYVDAVNGDNTRTTAEAQNPATPWKCITVAATGAAVGDTVHVAPGYYLTATGEAFPITITGRYFISTTTGLATIDSGTKIADAIHLGAGATLDGFTVLNAAPSNYYYDIYVPAANAHIRNCTLKQNSTAAQNRVIWVDAGGDRVSIEGNSLTTNTSNTSAVVTFTSGADNPIIRNNIIYGPGSQTTGIDFGTTVAPTVEGNTITVGYSGIVQTGTSTNQNILNNKVIAVGTNNNYGFYVGGTAATSITGTISGNEFRNWNNSAGSSGIRIENTNANYTISKNTLVKNTNGVRVGAGTATVRDNIISAGPRDGTYLSGSTGIYQSGGTITSTYNNLFNNITTYYGTVGSQSNDNTSNPRFVNPDGNDYRLFSDSPCKNTASDGGNRGAYAATDTTSGITTESYVDDGGSDVTGDGTLGNPWRTITKGLGSTEGTVYVRAGTYTAAKGETFPLAIGSGQKLINYLTEAATIDSSTTAINTVNLANNATLEGMTVNNSSNQSAVYLVGPDSQLINSTIYQAGSGGSGAAVYYASDADRCLLEGNTITGGSNSVAALYLLTGVDNPIVRNNTIVEQKTSSAYAIYFGGTSSYPTIEGNTITTGYNGIIQVGICTNQNILNNKIIGTGSNINAGIYFQTNSTGTVASNEVRGWSGTSGAGIYVSGSTANLTLNKNTLVKNTYGVQVTNGTVNIQNCIISAAPRGGTYLSASIGIYRTGGTVTSTYNDLFNNVVNYSGTVGSQSNDITTNPRFVNPDGNDYQLFSDSPCKNTASDGGNRGAYAATGVTSGITTESYVDDGGSDVTGDGTLGNPWKTVTKGLGSTEGTVYVRAGTYNTANGNTLPVSLAAGQTLKGYASEIATVEGNGSNHVVLIGSNATIDNIYLKLTGNYYGVYAGASNVNITRSKIIGNSQGSGIYFDGALTGVTPGGNITTCEVGAVDYGINLYGATSCGNITIEGNTIRDYDIWGIYIYWGQSGASNLVDIKRNILNNCNNASGTSYGGIYAWLHYTGTVNIINNTIVKNSLGIYAYRYSSTLNMNIRNNIISDTPRPDGGPRNGSYGLYKDQALSFISSYNNVWNQRTNFYGVSAGTGDISAYPRFVDPWNNNFDLYSDSPCIGTGSGGANIGAYEGAGAANSPYRTTSYVNNTTGVDAVTSGESVSNPYKTVTFANKYTLGTINVAASSNKYNSTNSETFPIDLGAGGGKRLSGADSGSVTLEGYGTDTHLVPGSSLVYGLGAFTSTTIEGITLQGMGNNTGVYFYGSNPIIQNSIIKGPLAGTGSSGKGVYFDGTNGASTGGTVSTCEITSLDYGIYFTGSTTCGNITIEGNDIHDNYQWGIYHYFWAPTSNANNFIDIKRNLIRNCLNTSTSYGGIYAWTYFVTLNVNRNTIVKNPIGIYAYRYDSYLTLIAKNNIVASEIGGFSVTGSKGILREGGTLTNTYNDVYSNDTNWSGVASGEGSISADALFVNATNNDFHLQQGSPAIDSGTPAGTDMGAYDYSSTTPTVTLGSPNGGETWGAGAWHNITWETTNTPDSINLYYITSEATGYQTIATGISDNGSYPWLVPNRATSTAKVSVEAVKAAETARDESAAYFTITAATNYYVDATNGNNAYSGITSEVSGTNGPWKTLTYASTQAAASSTTHVAAGTYNAALGESFPIAIANLNFISSASPTTLATIDAGSSNCITLGAAGYLAGFDLKSTTTDKVIYVTGASAYIVSNRMATSYSITSNYDIDVADAGDNILIQGNTIDSKRTNNIRLETGADNPIVKDNTLTTAQSYQTGIYVNWVTTRVTVEGNTIVADQGIYLGNSCSNIDIRTNVISPYSADSSAYKGMFLRGTGTVASNEVRGYKNYDTSNTAAIYIYDGTITVRNNTLVNNVVGVGNSYGTATIKNNIISAAPKLNSIYTDYGGGLVNSVGIWGRAGYTTNASYNNVFNNYANYSGSSITRSNELNTCPRFVNPDTNDFRLYYDSPSRATADDGGNRGRYSAIGTSSGITAESYVSTAGNDSTGDGSLSNPWKTVTKAVSSTEGTVYVRAGNFTANETFPLVLTGGQKATRYLTESASIDATGAGAKHTFITGSAATIESLTLTANNTNASYFSIYSLGNTHIKNNTLNAAVSGVYLRANYCTVEGNAITMSGSSGYGVTVHDSGDYSLIQNNSITANASDGRGIRLENYADNITVSGNTVEARAFGMEVASYNNNYNITNNILRGAGVASSYGIYASYVYTGSISSNEVSNFYYGIQADCNSGTSTIWNNTIVNFTTGIYSSNGAAKVIKNNIVSSLPTFPSLPTSGTKGIDHIGGTTTLKNNDIWNNETNYSNTSAGTGDISQNPRFVSAASSDFRLYSDSPCAAGGEGGTYIGRFPALGTTSGITTESYVSVSGNDTTGSGTLTSPWRTVTKGLGSTEGTVYVRAGTYTAGETFPLVLPAGEQLKGYLTEAATIDCTGISGKNTVNLGSNTTLEGLTIINAEGSGAYHTIYAASSGSHIKNNKIYQNGAASGSYALYLTAAADQCSIEGNTIQTGSSNDITVYLSSGANDPIIRNNNLTGTKSSNYVLYFAGTSSSPIIQSNTITGTYFGIYQGGALTNQDLSSNKIIATGSNHVYGIYMGSNSTGIVSTNEVRGWNAYSYSYGIWVGGFSSNLTFNKNTIVKCQTALATGGTANITNNIIAGEIGGFSGSNVKGIDNDSSGTVTSTYNDIYANDITYEGTVSNKTGDLQQNPLFVDAANNDYHLTSTSPAIDAGDPASPHDPDGTRADMGEYYFNQTNDAPSVTLLTPSGGQSLTGGASYNITWAATQPASGVDHVDIYYSTNSGSTYPNLIVAGTSNDGTHPWTVPTINSTTDRVKVIAVSGVGVLGTGESSSDFSITTDSQGPTVEVTSPIGGELWKGGSTHNITFTATDEAGLKANSLYAWYSTNGGSTYPNIITSEAIITSPFVWNIPATINSQTVRVRLNIWDAYNNIGTGESSASFTIDSTPPTVTVLSPTGGDKWQGGTSHDLTWTATDNFTLEANPITLQYSIDAGSSRTDIATGEANDGSYSWTTLSTNTDEARIKVLAQDVCGNIGSAESANFVIDSTAPTAPTLLAPANGSATAESRPQLSWNAAVDSISGISSYEVTIDTNVVTIDATTSYTTPDALSAAAHSWKVKAKNGVGLWGDYSETWTFTTGVGPSAAGIALKDRVYGSTQYSNSLTISLEVHDATGSPTQRRTAQDSAFSVNDTGWLTYATTSEYTFTAGEGSRTAYFKMRDAFQNESGAYNASIVIDTVPPSQVTLLTPANNSYTNDTTPTFTWNAATDATSGVASYEVVIDTTQIATVGAVTTYTTPDAESQGLHNWKARAKDNAQNWGEYSTTWNLTVETTNPTVTLGKPNGGETLASGASYSITWEAADNFGLKTDPVTLNLSTNGGSSWSTIQAGISYVTGEGTYSWTVPSVSSTTCLVSIEVEDNAGNKGYDISNSTFTISNTQPTATVTYPNGGEYLKGATAYNITWIATGEPAPVAINLRYSTNSGSSWTLIASNESNDGTYAWTTPAIDSITDRVSVEAVDGLGRVGTGQSAANFAIDSTTPEVAVVAPSGGERLAGGSSYNIQWTATDTVGLPANPITLRYSTDSGSSWTPIAAAQPNTSPYAWTVPTVNSTTVRVSVEATDRVGFTGTAQSASDFIIDSTTPTVLTVSPTDGATSVSISATVIIVFSKEMSREATQNAFSLSASPAVSGGFSWSGDGKTLTFTPAAALEYNTLYTVAVAAAATDLAGNHLTAFSSSFTTAPRGDSEAPHIIIQRVDAQGVANTLKDGDYIPKQPRFKGVITDNLGVSRATIKFYLDDVETAATITEVSVTRYEVAYTVTSNLEGETVRTHSVKLVASDTAGNSTTQEITGLKVSYESGKVIGPVLTYPTTYNPLTGQPARLAYNLTADQDVMLYMLDISGQVVWTGKYPSGAEGGKAGYNEILFYGRSEISGTFLGNGIYIYKLVAGNRVIGTGRLAIF
ncbi:right-handed parallel beta-helix repeat-containing protein [Candidatus Saganbacteria bacterium]|nr:right-handed parallel beta-helix repeat-containing protein [Candidatus Saganbacteria bacterium]